MDVGESFLQMTEQSACSKNIMEGVVDGKDDQRVETEGGSLPPPLPSIDDQEHSPGSVQGILGGPTVVFGNPEFQQW